MDAMKSGSASGSNAGCLASLYALRKGIFGAFYVIGKRMKQRGHLYLAITLSISLLQLISFVSSPVLRWHDLPSTRWLSVFSNVALLDGLRLLTSDTVYLLLFYAAFIWAAVFCGLFAWTIWCFVTASFPVLWPLHLLRIITPITVNEMYIPLLNMLITAFRCQDHHMTTGKALGITCYSAGHLLQAVPAAFFSFVLFFLCAQFALIFYDADALSRSSIAKVHGRGDFTLCIIKTVLVVFVRSFPVFTSTWGVLCLILACATAWFASLVYWMPYTHHNTTRAVATVAGVFCYAAVAALIAEVAQGFDAGILFFVGLPPVAVASIAVVDWRAKWVRFRPLRMLNNAMEVEMKVRFQIHEWLYGHYTDRMRKLATATGPVITPPHSNASNANNIANTGSSAAHDAKKSLGAAGGGNPDTVLHISAANASRHSNASTHPSAVQMATSPPPATSPKHGIAMLNAIMPDDAESQLVLARNALTREQLAEVEGLFREGCWRFKTSSMLHLFFSRYYADFRQNKHLEMSHLMAAERVGAAFDVAFMIYKARKQTEDSMGGKGDMSALQRVTFEKFQADARKQMARAMRNQMALWSELLNPTIDLAKLHTLSMALSDADKKAEEAFTQLLLLNPQSLLVLRLYSDFCLRVQNNAEKASLLVADAERIEEAAAKEHSKETGALIRIMMHSNLDVMSDTTGFITISGSPSSLGTIINVNASACRLFGYSRWQLERRNISVVTPEPFASWHDFFLRRYLSSGEGHVVDYTRCLFGLHKGGYLVPLVICVRESNGADKNPEFIGLVRPLTTPEHHILMDDDFNITGATLASFQALDIEPASLVSEGCNLRDWVPELEGVLDDLKQSKGTTLCFDPLSAKQAAALRKHSGSFDQYPQSPAYTGRGMDRLYSTDSMAQDGSAQTWARAHLHEVRFQSGLAVKILYWQRLGIDQRALLRAEARRSAILSASMQMPSRNSHQDSDSSEVKAPGPHSVRSPLTQLPSPSPSNAGHNNAPHPIPQGASRGCPMLLRPNVLIADPTAATMMAPTMDSLAFVTRDDNLPHLTESMVAMLPGQAETVDFVDLPEPTVQRVPPSPAMQGQTLPRINSPKAPVAEDAVNKSMKYTVSRKQAGSLSGPGELAFADHQSRCSADSTGTRKMITSLRKILRDRDDSLLPALQWLRIAGILVTIVSIILAIIVVVISSMQYTSYAENMRSASLAARLMENTVLCGHAAREMYFGTAGLLSVSGSYGAYLTTMLSSNLAEFTDTLGELSRFAFSSGREDLYALPSTLTTIFSYDPYSMEVRNRTQVLSLLEACMTFKAETESVLAVGYLNVSDILPSTRFVIESGLRGSVHDALNASMLEWFRFSVSSKSAVLSMWTSVYVAMSAILFAMAACVFLPVLIFVDQAKDEVVRRFTALPRSALLKLRADAEGNLKRFTQADDDEDAHGTDSDDDSRDGIDDGRTGNDDDDDEEAEWDNIFRRRKRSSRVVSDADRDSSSKLYGSLVLNEPADSPVKYGVRGNLAAAGDPSRVDRTASQQRKQVRDAPAPPAKGNRFRKSRIPLLRLSLRFMSPLVALFVFFTILYFVAVDTLRTSLALSSMSYMAHTRTILIMDVASQLRDLIGSMGQPSTVAYRYDNLVSAIDSLEYTHRVLMFGGVPVSPEMVSALQADMRNGETLTGEASALVSAALTGDICSLIGLRAPNVMLVELLRPIIPRNASASRPTDPTAESIALCKQRLRGVLLNGLHGALSEYIRITRFYAARRIGATVYTGGVGVAVTGNVSVQYSIKNELEQEDVQSLRDFGFTYLALASDEVADIYADGGRRRVERFILFESVFSTTFLLAFMAFMSLFYLPAVTTANADIHKQRSLLLLIPSQLLKRSPDMKALIYRILVGEANAAGQRIR